MASAAGNDSFDWARDASADVKDAFEGSPTRALLPTGTLIGRFATRGSPRIDGPGWVDLATLEGIVERTASASRIGIGATARRDLAVTTEWSPRMDQIYFCRLCAPYWAWRGRASRQPLTYATDRLLPGGEVQLFIPQLDSRDLVKVGTPGSFLAPPGRA